MLRRRADDEAQLALVIQLLGDARVDVVIRAADAGRLLVEPRLVLRPRDAELVGLLEVLAIVHADGEILARAIDGREQVRVGEREGRRRPCGRRGDGGEPGVTGGDDGGHRVELRQQRRDVDDMLGATIAGDDADMHPIAASKPDQLHRRSPRHRTRSR